jgi:acyl carrier protein
MIIEEFELDPEKVQPDTDLGALGVDSLSIIEFLFKVEERFNVVLPDQRQVKDLNAVKTVKTVRDIANELDALIAANSIQPNP